MAKKGTSPANADKFRSNLKKLETLAGSQKKLAEQLGVSSSTVRRWKNGKTAPAKDIQTKVNRKAGANTKKFQTPEFEEKFRKREQRSETLSKRRTSGREVLDIRTWLDKYFKDKLSIREQARILDMARANGMAYAAFDREAPTEAQFMTVEQYMDKKFGKPAKLKSVVLIGIVSTYQVGHSRDIQLFRQEMLNAKWAESLPLEETLEITRDRFMGQAAKVHRVRKSEPQEFISYFFY